jgi:drug/metabolite transporter (DMT)-like permease
MFFFSLVNYFTKVLRKKYDAYSITFYKNLIALIALFIPCCLFYIDELIVIDINILFAFAQGFISDFMGWTLFVYLFKYVDLNKAIIIYSFSGILTMVYSFIVFGINIMQLQLIGGALIFIGNIIFNSKKN